MERLVWDLHQVVSELQALPGALLVEDNHSPNNTTRITNTNAAAHRRSLRRLDRALLQLETELQNQQQLRQEENCQDLHNDQQRLGKNNYDDKNDMDEEDLGLHQDSQDSAACNASRSGNYNSIDLTNKSNHEMTPSNGPLIPEPLQEDLRILLKSLALPVNQEDVGVGQLAASILEKLANFWINYKCGATSNGRQLRDTDVVVILQRLLDSRSFDIKSGDITTIWCKAASAWLYVLNTYFMETSEDEGNEDSTDLQTGLVLSLPAFLLLALETVQATPWEPAALNDVVTETHVQWRILTGYLIEYTIRLQQQQLRGDPTVPDLVTGAAPEEWLHNCFQDANPSFPPEFIMNNVHDVLTNLTVYTSELADYALDALDGAAVIFTATAVSGNELAARKSKVSFYSEQESQNTGSVSEYKEPEEASSFEEAESAVEDSLRHVTLATNALIVVQHWCSHEAEVESHSHRLWQVQQQQAVSLWKTMSTSFMAKSNFTTVLNHAATRTDQDNEMHAAQFICEHQLQLANLVLSSPLEQQQQATNPPGSTGGYEKTLALTFLRALDFPDLLLGAEKLWQAIEQRIKASQPTRSSIDLKRALQAAILTLHRQHMLPTSDGGGGTAQQQGAQAIVDRLLPILLHGTGNDAIERHPWDGFFMRSLGL